MNPSSYFHIEPPVNHSLTPHQSYGSVNVVHTDHTANVQQQHNHLQAYTNQQIQTPPRGVDNRPAWMMHSQSPSPSKRVDFDLKDTALPDEPSHKQGRLFVVSAGIFVSKLAQERLIRQMPLELDNGLPGIVLRLGKADEQNASFLCHVDSCAAMNTGNLLLHQYIITHFPDTVAEYIQYDDKEPFEPIRLECAVQDVAKVENEHGKLTAIVRYYTPYVSDENKPVLLSFGLGSGVAVRSIIGKPTLKAWKCIVDFGTNKLIAPGLQRRFDLEYEEARSGLPDGVTFQKQEFQRPQQLMLTTAQSQAKLMQAITDGCDDGILTQNESSFITDTKSNGYLQRSVDLHHL